MHAYDHFEEAEAVLRQATSRIETLTGEIESRKLRISEIAALLQQQDVESEEALSIKLSKPDITKDLSQTKIDEALAIINPPRCVHELAIGLKQQQREDLQLFVQKIDQPNGMMPPEKLASVLEKYSLRGIAIY